MNVVVTVHELLGRVHGPICANGACNGGLWTRWKSRRHGILVNSDWYCSYECMQSGLRNLTMHNSAITRHRRDTPHRLPMGLLLLSRGLIDESQLSTALARKRERPSARIGECLQLDGAITEIEVARALGAQHSLPVLLDSRPQLDPDVPVPFQQITETVCFRSHPGAGTLYVGFGGTVNMQVARVLEFLLSVNVEACVVSASTVRRLTEEAQQRANRAEVLLNGIENEAERIRTLVSYARQTVADHVVYAASQQCLWTRLRNQKRTTDVIFASGRC